ncbi:MAG: hypothetical protein JWO38_1564 [Gemmataceae bacterium]|nr:hypothetical protein [Gemmataceae bacterium]
MRSAFGLTVGVLAAVLAGSGCCKLCDWCRGDRPREEGPPPLRSNAVVNPPLAGPMTQPAAAGPGRLPPATTLPPGAGPTGAYNGTGN